MSECPGGQRDRQRTQSSNGNIVVVGLRQLAEDLEVIGQDFHLTTRAAESCATGARLALKTLRTASRYKHPSQANMLAHSHRELGLNVGKKKLIGCMLVGGGGGGGGRGVVCVCACVCVGEGGGGGEKSLGYAMGSESPASPRLRHGQKRSKH